jgi:hypothetical protein
MNKAEIDDEFNCAIKQLSSKAFHNRVKAVKMMHARMLRGCWLSRLMLEYVLEHDPNSAIRNRVFLIFKRSSLAPRDGFWEKHICL